MTLIKPNVLFLIASDPRLSPKPAEAVRIAALGPPPWEHARELVAGGIVDTTFALTPRGRRALARRRR